MPRDGALLEVALNSGEIRFVPLEPVRTRVVAAQQQRPYTPPKPSVVEEEDHFIGLRLKDSKNQPVRNSRVRFTFPDGTQKEAKTNSAGEVLVKGIAVTGNAKIELLDVCTPGAAEAPVWPEEKEYRVKVTDEAGNGVPGVWVKFVEAKKYNLVPADGNGVAVYKTTADEVSATFHDVNELGSAMKPIWDQAAALAHADWLKPERGKRTVLTVRGGALQERLPDTEATAISEHAGAAASDGASAVCSTKAVASAAGVGAAIALKSAAAIFTAFAGVTLSPGQEHQISVQPLSASAASSAVMVMTLPGRSGGRPERQLVGGIDQWLQPPDPSQPTTQLIKKHKPFEITLVSLTVGYGWMTETKPTPSQPASKTTPVVQAIGKATRTLSAYFRKSSATLEGRNRAALEEAIAIERAIFVSGGGHGVAVGHASPEGPNNEDLSQRRAEAVVQAVTESLGGRLAFDLTAIGRGHEAALSAGLIRPEDIAAGDDASRREYLRQEQTVFVQYRCVMLIVNGVMLVRLNPTKVHPGAH